MVNFKDYCTNDAIHEVVDTYIDDKMAKKDVQITKDGRKWVVIDHDKELRISSSLKNNSDIFEFFALVFASIAFAFNCIRPEFYEYYSEAIKLINDIENPAEKKGRFSLPISDQEIDSDEESENSDEEMQIEIDRGAKNALPIYLRNLSEGKRQKYVDKQIELLTEKFPPKDYKGQTCEYEDVGVTFVCDGNAWRLPEVKILKPAFFIDKTDEEVGEYIESRTDEYDEKYSPADFEGQSIVDEHGVQFYCDGESWNFKE